jgi:ABC-type antimicrobial peptide transport system permease subunit
VARRTREFGIRMALGASRAGILRLVLGEALRLTAAGTAVGLVGAVAAAAALGGLLNGMSPFVPAPFVLVAAALTGVALVAALLPARRATRVQPTAALRQE